MASSDIYIHIRRDGASSPVGNVNPVPDTFEKRVKWAFANQRICELPNQEIVKARIPVILYTMDREDVEYFQRKYEKEYHQQNKAVEEAQEREAKKVAEDLEKAMHEFRVKYPKYVFTIMTQKKNALDVVKPVESHSGSKRKRDYDQNNPVSPLPKRARGRLPAETNGNITTAQYSSRVSNTLLSSSLHVKNVEIRGYSTTKSQVHGSRNTGM